MKLLQLRVKVTTRVLLFFPSIISRRIIFSTMNYFSYIFYNNGNQNKLNQLAPNSKNCTVSSCNTGHVRNSPDANSNRHKTNSSTNILYRTSRGSYSSVASCNHASVFLDHDQRKPPSCYAQLLARVRSPGQKLSVS